jgi:pyruvate,water dikinase
MTAHTTLPSLADPVCLDVAVAGGKGASLARMADLGLPVPDGFVVPADRLAVTLPDRGGALRKLLLGAADDAALRAVAGRARGLIAAAPVVGELRWAIAKAYGGLGADVAVAVRSSACAEDSEAASYAGQQESYLEVRGAENVMARVVDCWMSFFTERALFYRARKGSLHDLSMAVVVQRMIDADVAGVLFTNDPVQRRRDRMVVEAVLGLGEGVVSGRLTPDHYVLARDGTVKKAAVSTQPYAIVSAPGGGTEERALSAEEGAVQKVSEEQLRELARIGDELERRLGAPQDVEWALRDGELYVLQARPVTA